MCILEGIGKVQENLLFIYFYLLFIYFLGGVSSATPQLKGEGTCGVLESNRAGFKPWGVRM